MVFTVCLKTKFISKIDEKVQNVCPNISIDNSARKIKFTIPNSALQQENFGG